MIINKKFNITLMIGIVILLVGVFVLINQPKETKDIPGVQLKESIKNKQFALMVEQTKGKGDYQDSSTTYHNSFPAEGYKLNEAKSNCTDINGKTIENAITYDSKTYSITINANKTAYCYLYYDIYEKTILDTLRENDPNNHLSKTLIDGLYRYQGNSIVNNAYIDGGTLAANVTDTIDNNYICLESDCSLNGNDIYRIIGVTENNELKIINIIGYKELQWNTTCEFDTPWPNSLIFSELNGDNSSFLNSLNPNLKDKIIDYNWKYGAIQPDIDKLNELLNQILDVEEGLEKDKLIEEYKQLYLNAINEEEKLTDKSSAKVGLISMIDYCYSFENPIDCFSTLLLPYDPTTITTDIKLSWLSPMDNVLADGLNRRVANSVWTMSYFGNFDSFTYAWFIDYYADFNAIDENLNLKPVFYLSSNIELEGTGTLTNPYKIKNLDI